jgi:hypothetical protein
VCRRGARPGGSRGSVGSLRFRVYCGFRVQGLGFRSILRRAFLFRIKSISVNKVLLQSVGSGARLNPRLHIRLHPGWNQIKLGTYQILARYLRLPTLKIRVDMLS